MDSRRTVRLWFSDFWPIFKIEDNFFLKIIDKKYNIILDDKNPEFLFYSVFGNNFENYNCMKIQFLGEQLRPDLKKADYAMSFDYIENNPRHYRLPLYGFYDDLESLTQPVDIEKVMQQKTRFCNFICSNPNPKYRTDFFKKLSKYKKVDSGGLVLNNLGGRVRDKMQFISKYKFTMAFENESYPGYTTEKIIEPMLSRSIPIYWGNKFVGEEFNAKSFVNRHDYANDDEMIECIIQIDNDDSLWAEYLTQPCFIDNKLNKYVDRDNILSFFDKIFNSDKEPKSNMGLLRSANPALKFFGRIKAEFDYIRLDWGRVYVKNFSLGKILYKLKRIKKMDFNID